MKWPEASTDELTRALCQHPSPAASTEAATGPAVLPPLWTVETDKSPAIRDGQLGGQEVRATGFSRLKQGPFERDRYFPSVSAFKS